MLAYFDHCGKNSWILLNFWSFIGLIVRLKAFLFRIKSSEYSLSWLWMSLFCLRRFAVSDEIYIVFLSFYFVEYSDFKDLSLLFNFRNLKWMDYFNDNYSPLIRKLLIIFIICTYSLPFSKDWFPLNIKSHIYWLILAFCLLKYCCILTSLIFIDLNTVSLEFR